jgi:MoaA/NifB/PqqE/SkfB family radical SAM enzyme
LIWGSLREENNFYLVRRPFSRRLGKNCTVMAALLEKIRLLQGLQSGEIALTAPFFLTIDVTRRCNLRCFGCRYHSPDRPRAPKGDVVLQDYPLELFRQVIAELNTMGARSLCISGEGEPFLHPHLLDFVRLTKKAGLHLVLLTNGTLLDEANIRSLIASRLDVLKVSLWANSPEDYDRSSPGTGPGNFHKVLAGLKLLAGVKAAQKTRLPAVILHQPVTRDNFHQTPALIDLALATGCEGLSFSPFKTRRAQFTAGVLAADEERSFCQALKQSKKRLKVVFVNPGVDQILRRFRIGEAVWEKLPCYIGWLHAYLKVDGTVLPCGDCDLVMGNLHDNSLQEIWNGPAFRAFRRQALTRAGLRAFGHHCDCAFCCHVLDNARVHRIFRWVAPFCATGRSRHGEGGNSCART